MFLKHQGSDYVSCAVINVSISVAPSAEQLFNEYIIVWLCFATSISIFVLTICLVNAWKKQLIFAQLLEQKRYLS